MLSGNLVALWNLYLVTSLDPMVPLNPEVPLNPAVLMDVVVPLKFEHCDIVGPIDAIQFH